MKKYYYLFIYFVFFTIISCNTMIAQVKWRLLDSITYATPLKGISCYDSLNCVAVGNEGDYFPIAKLTSDGGKTWTRIFKDTSIFDSNNNVIWQHRRALDVAYPDSNLIFILCDYGVYWYSTNKGITWEKPGDWKSGELLENYCSFYNSKIGGTIIGYVWITYDGCKTFNQLTLPDSIYSVIDLSVPDSTSIILLCSVKDSVSHYIVSRSTNKGKTWTLNPFLPKKITRIKFYDSLNGYGYGGERVTSQTDSKIILKTTDGGYSWKVLLDSVIGNKKGRLYQLSFDKERKNGIAIGYYNTLIRTSDGGESWWLDNSFYDEAYTWPSDAEQISSKRIFVTSSSKGDIWEFNEDGFTAVNEILFEDNLLLYPNPARDFLEITHPPSKKRGSGGVSMVIYDVLGVEQFTLTPALSLKGEGVRIDISGLSPGVYFVRVGDVVRKFVRLQ